MIEVAGLHVHYGAMPALADVTLRVPAGQFLLVTGPSGCGKSTLARVLSGLIPHAIPAHMAGQVRLHGRDTRTHPLPQLAQQAGIVLQNPAAQLFHLRVADELAFGPRNLGLPEVEVAARVEWALAATGLTGLRERRPADLSGGEKQRVAIAAVLAMRPQILILDEPTASLDLQGTRMVLSTIARLNRELGLTVILLEHRLGDAMPLADRLIIMDAGRIVADGPPETLLHDRELRDRYGLRRPHETAPAAWEKLLAPNGKPPAGAQPLLTLEGVAAGYRKHPVLHDVNLTLHAGEFVALVGENGAGKSTLALVAAGLLKPATGRVAFNGGKRPRPGRDVTLLFQNPVEQLFTDSVAEEVAFGPRNYGAFRPDFHAETLREADLEALVARCPTHLSVGQQQRTVLAACVAMQPRLLILDEPTLGQDWHHLQRLMDFVLQLNARGAAILLISHDYKLVYRYARRVLLMEQGRLVLDGRPLTQSTRSELEMSA